MPAATDSHVEQAVTQVVAMFEHLSLTDLPHMGRYYALDAHFKDPFNEVQGLDAIQGIFAHMFESLHAPRLWPEYHPGYFGAFVRDPDGNKLCVVCHEPEQSSQ